MYSNKNGLKLTSKQVKTLKKHKKGIIKLVSAKDETAQLRCLTNKLIDVMLAILLSVVKDLESND